MKKRFAAALIAMVAALPLAAQDKAEALVASMRKAEMSYKELMVIMGRSIGMMQEGVLTQNRELVGVVVLFVQIGALCSENPLHDKHLRFRHFRALRTFRADWCASAPAAL